MLRTSTGWPLDDWSATTCCMVPCPPATTAVASTSAVTMSSASTLAWMMWSPPGTRQMCSPPFGDSGGRHRPVGMPVKAHLCEQVFALTGVDDADHPDRARAGGPHQHVPAGVQAPRRDTPAVEEFTGRTNGQCLDDAAQVHPPGRRIRGEGPVGADVPVLGNTECRPEGLARPGDRETPCRHRGGLRSGSVQAEAGVPVDEDALELVALLRVETPGHVEGDHRAHGLEDQPRGRVHEPGPPWVQRRGSAPINADGHVDSPIRLVEGGLQRAEVALAGVGGTRHRADLRALRGEHLAAQRRYGIGGDPA